MNLMKQLQDYKLANIDYKSVFNDDFISSSKYHGFDVHNIKYDKSGVLLSGIINANKFCKFYAKELCFNSELYVYFIDNKISCNYVYDGEPVDNRLLQALEIKLYWLVSEFNESVQDYKNKLIDEDNIISDLHDAGFL